MLVMQRPVIDECAWTVGLGTADGAYGNHPERCKRAIWMHPKESAGDLPTTGKHDFFKLLVFDMVLNKLLSKVSRERLDSLMPAMMPAIGERRMQKVVQKVAGCDIGVLIEIPSTLIPGLEDYYVIVSFLKRQGFFVIDHI